jgi:hypothetical protein
VSESSDADLVTHAFRLDGRIPGRRIVGLILASAVAVAVVLVAPLSKYSSGDVNRIHSDYVQILAGCREGAAPARMSTLVGDLSRLARVSPDLPLQITGGNSDGETPRLLLRDVSATLGGTASTPSQCPRFAALGRGLAPISAAR